ncbi:HEPN-associated N-terminal domain-containing protein [Pelomonas aquatica]|jgi:hypothetical protein|uniref:RES domain-containing protein n=4 Tax=Pseudomonadota TaxID=1224 RepID=A0A9X4LKG5_9BURK|nr:HEPN-associated N-terminal domain-containing protein [Pelomonas aquatica]MBI3348325.1 RES domain-containing protein [Burkholderiales bacterium]MCY4756807.1 HEPN-associated N-terminal domain-containing protein [Pelomonas aquatica]MDG0864152.1 RES domain-containing protein [Pelomonas aquatica]|mmetsp:Transcript_53287/g.125065  ORF Transcript_53287/g.125065 Transcript_53287/m.125065 type:complete len:376 (+) Transcript_53287:4553-5680(+)
MPDYVCSACFEDEDLSAWISRNGEHQRCDFCGRIDAPAVEFKGVSDFITACIEKYWGRAVDQMPYETAEGGYIGGNTWDTYDLLRDEIALSLPRDHKGKLFYALLHALPDETWCDHDWTCLDLDQALLTSWESFCETVKHRRRFFFHSTGSDDVDSYTPASLLATIASASREMGLVREIEEGTSLWRARTNLPSDRRELASEYGTPPLEFATQSNRMNPPGIPMLYVASSRRTAVMETRVTRADVGRWLALKPLRVLDLRELPAVPGLFSEVGRQRRLVLRFLHAFAADVMKPVERDERVHIDYLPSQVVTEFLRDFAFPGGRLDGIAYGSTVHRQGWNVVLFAEPVHLGLQESNWRKVDPWLRFDGASAFSTES